MRRTLIDYSLITSSLSDNAFRVYAYLLVHANKDGECWPSLVKISEQTNRSKRSTDFAISELKSAGLLQSFNEGRGRYRYQLIEQTSATDCASNDTGRAQKTTGTSATDCARSDETSAKSEGNERKKRPEQAQKTTIPPAPPYIGEQYNRTINRTISFCDETNEQKNEEQKNSSLENLVTPENQIPPKLLRMATALHLEVWLGSVQFHEISMDDWRIAETLSICQQTGKKCNARYAWTVFNNLPEKQPEKVASETNGYHRPRETYESMKQKEQEDAEFITNLIKGKKWTR